MLHIIFIEPEHTYMWIKFETSAAGENTNKMATAVDCGQVDPLWMAMSKLRRGRLQECITICDEILSANPSDQAAWIIKCKAVIKQNYIDDIEMDEEGVAEMLLDENAGLDSILRNFFI